MRVRPQTGLALARASPISLSAQDRHSALSSLTLPSFASITTVNRNKTPSILPLDYSNYSGFVHDTLCCALTEFEAAGCPDSLAEGLKQAVQLSSSCTKRACAIVSPEQALQQQKHKQCASGFGRLCEASGSQGWDRICTYAQHFYLHVTDRKYVQQPLFPAKSFPGMAAPATSEVRCRRQQVPPAVRVPSQSS